MKEWLTEPNEKRWETRAGYAAKINRTESGALCGYVGVPEGHPLFGIGFGTESPALRAAYERRMKQPVGDAPAFSVLIGALFGDMKPTPDTVLRVHGGITWSEKMPGGRTEKPDGRWWFGFDCSHAGDLRPRDRERFGPLMAGFDEVYRNFAYVEAECESLAEQLAAIAKEVSSAPPTRMSTIDIDEPKETP